MSSDVVPGLRKHNHSGAEALEFAMTGSANGSIDLDKAWGMPRYISIERDSGCSLMSATHD